MKKLFLNIGIYSVLISISLEILVRIFYLGEDKPKRFVDEYNVEKWVPGQEGYSITGNRNQNFIKYHINDSGFNSYREFSPTRDKIEIALVGDSFVEGFHQPYTKSTGRYVEQFLNDAVEVYEYGYAGYDMADQLHLMHAYKADFDLIDRVYIKMKFSNDLNRDAYEIVQSRLNLESPFNRFLKKSKLLTYFAEIGILSSPRAFLGRVTKFMQGTSDSSSNPKPLTIDESEYLNNFKKLTERYGYNKEKYVLLIDASKTSPLFIDYIKRTGYKYLDFGSVINNAPKPTTLIFDKHWNDYGRKRIAKLIAEEIIQINTFNSL